MGQMTLKIYLTSTTTFRLRGASKRTVHLLSKAEYEGEMERLILRMLVTVKYTQADNKTDR